MAKHSKTRGLGLRDTLRRLLGFQTRHRQAAALPWRETAHGVEVMLVSSRDARRWVLPKGWPKRGEALPDAAAREAAEEAGISGAVSSIETGRYTYRKRRRGGVVMRCEVSVFPMHVDRVASDWPERDRRRVWLSPAEAAAKVREKGLAALLHGFSAGPRAE